MSEEKKHETQNEMLLRWAKEAKQSLRYNKSDCHCAKTNLSIIILQLKDMIKDERKSIANTKQNN